MVNNETNFENGKSSRLTSEIFFNFNISDSISISPFVSEFCILDSSEIKFDFLTDINHCHEYEEIIRVKPNFYCQGCERFLFVDQIDHISGEITIASVQYDRSSVLCNTCYKIIKEGEMPYLSAHGNALHIGDLPQELKCLNTMGKKLIALVEIFMTVIILPGGQFAQKGLALHRPSNVQIIASQLPQNVNNTSVFSVKFLHNAYTTEDYKF